MSRAGLSQDVVVRYALEVLDAGGYQALTLTAVARRAGVATPSLYKHVDGMPALRRLLTLRIHEELTARVGAAVMGRSGADALIAFLNEYRDAMRQHPHRMVMIERGLDDSPESQRAAAALLEVPYAVVRGFGLVGDDLIHAVRTLRAAVNGFTSLEAAQGYRLPTSADASFAFLARVLTVGLAEAATRPTTASQADDSKNIR